MSKKQKYNADSIVRLKGLEGVRLRAGMYIGDTDERGLLHLVKEIIGNSIDEAMSGHGDDIAIDLHKDGSVTVFDQGRGIPTGPHKSDKKTDTLTIIATELHSGGKLKDTEKNYSAGATIGCFVGGTKIKLLSGRSVRIDRLAKAFEETGKKRWVYAFNKDSGLSFVPRQAYGVFATRLATELTEVVLSNGRRVLCTPDHPFMLWDGTYVEAAKLKRNTSLRAVHFKVDVDGYLTHSGPHRLHRKKKVKQHMHRVNRTVAKATGLDIDGKDVAHKNANKKDNRPENLIPLDRADHWWHDRVLHGKNANWTHKSKEDRKRSRKAMERLNRQVEDLQEQAQLGRYAQIAARAYRDYGVVNEDTYNASRPWCGPKFNKALAALGSERNVLRAGKAYYRRYGKNGKTNNGGLGLDYKLQSEYDNSPAVNINNHSVVSIRTFKTKKPIQVYGMSVEVDHNYMLDAGVFVKNTHGVGLAVVNALSTELVVYTKSSGKWQQQSFSKGVPTSKVVPSKSVPKFNNAKWPHGTIVHFKPDLSVFAKGSKLKAQTVYNWLSQLSWFVYGPKRSKKDEVGTAISYRINIDGKIVPIKRTSLSEYALHATKKIKAEPLLKKLEPFVFSSKGCDVVYFPNTSDRTTLYAAVSAVETTAGGTHVTEMRKIFTDVMNIMRSKRQEFTIDDFLVGSVVVCNVKMTDAAFAGQSKERLTSKLTNQFDGLKEALLKWCKANRNSIQILLKRAVELNSLNISAALSKKLASALKTKKGGKNLLPMGLITCTTKNRDEREMFIVEGESAGGTTTRASDRRYQEIMLLRGKLLNVVKSSEKMTNSQVIVDVLKAVGYDPKIDYNKSRRVGKVYLLTDPDPDGSHISCLLMGLLYSVVPKLFDEGRVYDVLAPLYSYNDVKVRAYGSSLKHLKEVVGKGFNKDRVVRLKGWGEAEPSDLYEMAFNPKTRKVVQISTAQAAESKKAMMAILGEGSEFRKTLLGLSV